MSTLIGFPAVPGIDVAKFPFTAAALLGTDYARRIVDEAATWLARDGEGMMRFGKALQRHRWRACILAGRPDLVPQTKRTVSSASPFASEWGQDPAKCWPNVASRCD